jgi:uncharacterized protein YkwD
MAGGRRGDGDGIGHGCGVARSRARPVGVLVAGLLVAGTLASCTTSQPSATARPAATADLAGTAAAIERLVNEARADEGLPALAQSDCAADAAAERAQALVGDPDLAHAPMDGVLAGCEVATAGENLSRATAPAEDVVEAWLGSPGHRSNILDPEYLSSGVSCVADGDAVLCSQVFLGE